MYHSPLKFYEYLGHGLPVLSTPFEDSLAVKNDLEAGVLLFDGQSMESLNSQLSLLKKARTDFQRIWKKAHQLATEQHTWKHRVELILQSMGENE